MQKIATRVFMFASISFGIIGILMILGGSLNEAPMSDFTKVLQKLLFIDVCIILPSLALSIAGKYLKDNS